MNLISLKAENLMYYLYLLSFSVMIDIPVYVHPISEQTTNNFPNQTRAHYDIYYIIEDTKRPLAVKCHKRIKQPQ